MKYDLAVIGGGPAGLAAAYEAYKCGIQRIVIIERDKVLGGILNQCIHNGFGLHTFKEELTGPEYAERFIEKTASTNIEVKLDTMVLELRGKTICAINQTEGFMEIEAEAVILAMGCRERTRGAINVPGDRPSGIFTAGAAQRFINMEGYMVGKEVVILGSGDIGLIMARRMSLEGAKVKAVVEFMPYSNGLTRNIVQCLEDYDIPLYLSHTVTNIIGKRRLEKVVIAEVDENRRPVMGTEKVFECDTLLLSVGLIPENELSKQAGIQLDARTNGPVVDDTMQTSEKGIFACGNVLHVHDLVDFVTEEAQKAGRFAADFIKGKQTEGTSVKVISGNGISYTVPQTIKQSKEESLKIFMRVKGPCRNQKIVVRCEQKEIAVFKKKVLLPAEMQSIVLNKEQLSAVCGDVTVELEEAK